MFSTIVKHPATPYVALRFTMAVGLALTAASIANVIKTDHMSSGGWAMFGIGLPLTVIGGVGLALKRDRELTKRRLQQNLKENEAARASGEERVGAILKRAAPAEWE